jgi:hypothetical protein
MLNLEANNNGLKEDPKEEKKNMESRETRVLST